MKKVLSFLSIHRAVFLVFVLVFIGYLINLPLDYSKSLKTRTFRRLLTSYDVTAATFLPYEILTKGTIYFSQETVDGMKRVQDPNLYSVIKIKERYFSSYPILSAILSLPIYLIPTVLNKIPDLHFPEDLLKVLMLGRISASFYTAISVSIFYLILKEIDKEKKYPSSWWKYVFILFYAFGTNIYSIASRSLWQHTSSLLLITAIIYFLIKSLNNQKYIKWMGLFAGLLYLSRPLNIVFVVTLSCYVLYKYKNSFRSYILYSLPCVILLLLYNYYAFGNPLTSEYVVKGDTQFSTPLQVGLIGNLFSPARSFLFITPILIAAYYGAFKILKLKKKTGLDEIFVLLIITYSIIFVLYSKWWCWYGADRFGYGFFTEWIPILSLLSYTVFRPGGKYLKYLFFILMLWSLYTQFNAVWFRKSRCSGMSHNWTLYCLKPPSSLNQEY